MKRSTLLFSLVLTAATLPLQALAHNDHDRDHRPHHHKPGYKEVFWDGPCKVERKYLPHGRVKEKRECRPEVVYVQPQVVHRPPPPVVVQPGVVIQGTGTIRLP